MKRDDAYEAAGYKPHRQAAHRLLTNDSVVSRLAELRQGIDEKSGWPASDRLRLLLRIAERCAIGDPEAAVLAISEANRMMFSCPDVSVDNAVVSQDIGPSGFYVYHLFDPRDGVVFYVGKGTGARAWRHEANVRRGVVDNVFKCEKILEIASAGYGVGVRIVSDGLNEANALRLERREIFRIGCDSLTNISGGNRSSHEKLLCSVRGGFSRLDGACLTPLGVEAKMYFARIEKSLEAQNA